LEEEITPAVVTCGNSHTVCITRRGMMYTFGLGNRGELGLGPDVTGEVNLLVVLRMKNRVWRPNSVVVSEQHRSMHFWGSFQHHQAALLLKPICPLLPNSPNTTDVVSRACVPPPQAAPAHRVHCSELVART
jgi:hypothetical protein